jgi:TolB-like protein/tRNA A-37 threonylcarbamoyl transferase component Bud32
MALASGTRLGPYNIVALIGVGGMGEVYKARDPRLDRDVAIKVLPAELTSKTEMVQRFQREARAVAAVNHPSIVTIHSVEQADGVHFLTMELVEGQSLDRLIPASGLEVERILAIADALSGALAAAHEKTIVHRDLKPANIMLTDGGAVKVLDFGLAKLHGPPPDHTPVADLPTVMHSSVGVVMGTLPYMSPEQVQGRPLDHRTDIFSLGVVLYEMATGRRPFLEQSSAGLSAQILRDAPVPVKDVRAELPDELSRVIQRCLEKDPQRRIQTASDVRQQLREVGRRSDPGAPLQPARVGSGKRSDTDSAAGFWVAVVPFTCGGTNPDLAALCEGLTEEIVGGLSRFSYLRVLTKGTTGARYVLEGSLRQAGGQLRAAVRLIDTSTGANLWAENYTRPYSPDSVFELQDSLAPPIVSTIAEMNGVLAHSMWTTLRERDPETLTPYEAMLRSFGYYESFTPGEYRLALAGLKRAIAQEPNHAGCLTMLAIVYANGYLLHYDAEEKQEDLALMYARRAVAAEPSNPLAYYALSVSHVARKDTAAFLSAAERALALNPLDGAIMGEVALWMSYSGNWQRGRELMERAMVLNPRHPGFLWYPLVHDAYRQKDYSRALNYALRVNLPGQFWTHLVLAMVHGQLGNRDAAARALEELLAIYPDFSAHARQEIEKFFYAQRAHAEHVIEGLRKAGLEIPGNAPIVETAVTSAGDSGPMPADQGT